MSESYFPNHYDTSANGGPSVGYAGTMQQRPVDHYPTPGPSTHGDHPSNGYPTGPSYGQVPPPPPGTTTGPVPRRILGALAGAGVLVLVVGGYAFTTHGKLADAETKVAGLEQSLDKANKSVTAKQSEVESKEKELATAQQQGEQLGAAYDAAATCATQAEELFNLISSAAPDEQISSAYQAARESCAQFEEAQSSE